MVELCRRHGRDVDPPEAFLAYLGRFSWGGNVRELECSLQGQLLSQPDDPFQPEAWQGFTGA